MTTDEQLAATREFAKRVIEAADTGRDVDAGEIFDWAAELGLTNPEAAEATEGAQMLSDWMQVPSPADGLPYR